MSSHLVYHGHPALQAPTEFVTEDHPVDDIINDMWLEMWRHKGVGLAAPQIGVSLKMFIVDTGTDVIEALNPCITYKKDPITVVEGCLSIPGKEFEVNRFRQVGLFYHDLNWESHEIEIDGLLAHVVQHEYDHIVGKLCSDIGTPYG